MSERRCLKAEILITRRCQLSCPYCAIKQEGRHEIRAAEWIDIIDALKDGLDLPFAAIYGAEPLLYPELDAVIRHLTDRGIDKTIITNCIALSVDRLKRLQDAGLDSVTVSIDTHPRQPSPVFVKNGDQFALRQEETVQTLLGLQMMGLRDLEAIVTVSRLNLHGVIDLTRWLLDLGVWVSFDLIHWNKAEYGFPVSESKTAGIEQIGDLLFTEHDISLLTSVAEQLQDIAQAGARIHQPAEYFEFWKESKYAVHQEWRCSYPGWLTLDCDGSVLLCDDFDDGVTSQVFRAVELPDRWDEYVGWFEEMVKHCHGCKPWSTHWMCQELLDNEKAVRQISHRETWGRG